MNVAVALEHRFDRTPDGAVWTQAAFSYPFWKRYLEVFDGVRVVARVREVGAAGPDWKRADGEGVGFAAVPHYIGPAQYLWRARRIRTAARDSFGSSDAVILRVSSQIAAAMEPRLRREGHPYGVEVVGDPHDAFAPGAVRHPLRPFFRRWFAARLRQHCAGAVAASYVTARFLQSRYPPGKGAFATYYSDVELPDEAFVAAPRPAARPSGAFTLISVTSLAQLYKAPDVLIDAVGAGVRSGLDLRLVLVGDGKYQPELEDRASGLGLEDRVSFLGRLSSGDAVRTQLDRADLFALPSKTEGLPRAMIEAMARALPCVGSTVGGIPELLPPEDLTPPGDVEALVGKIEEVSKDPDRLARMSVRNLHKAAEYRDETLRERRLEFYEYLRRRTELWVESKSKKA